uniref:Uncharacterized protein n=1 Tax=Acrobeloides nanus TaxID=290746 RepID=A0A914DZI7_9BILA
MVCQGDGVIGSPGTRVGYTIKQVNNVGTLLCCKARGYQGNTEVWVDLLCSPDDVTGSVPWGSVAASKAIQCKGTPLGTSIEWS